VSFGAELLRRACGQESSARRAVLSTRGARHKTPIYLSGPTFSNPGMLSKANVEAAFPSLMSTSIQEKVDRAFPEPANSYKVEGAERGESSVSTCSVFNSFARIPQKYASGQHPCGV